MLTRIAVTADDAILTRIAVFVSGGGTNLQALLDAEVSGILSSGTIALVIADKAGIGAIDRANKAGVPCLVIPRQEGGFEGKALAALREQQIDMLVLAGFLGILSAEFIQNFSKPILNVHPSLIPSFCGRGYYGLKVHQAALDYGVKVTGATVHLVNEIPDGGRILLQKAVEVRGDDTPESLQRRVMEQAEWVLLPQAVEHIAAGILREKEEREKKRKKEQHAMDTTQQDAGNTAPQDVINTPRQNARSTTQQDLCALLRRNAYPGRGILLGNAYCSGTNAAVVAYFIMGRSENSRNRIFEETSDGIRTKAFDENRMTDPSLVIYHPVRVQDKRLIVTNGDQTDTIRKFLAEGKSFAKALRTREFEPDAPHYTPRISGLLKRNGHYTLSILKAGGSGVCNRYFFEYSRQAGTGHFISTYQGDGDPLPSFAGEPVPVAIDAPDAGTLADALWDSLDEDNKVSLFVRYIDWHSGFYDTVIINKHTGRFRRETKESLWR